MMPHEPRIDDGTGVARRRRAPMAAWAWLAVSGALSVISCGASTGAHPDASSSGVLDGDTYEVVVSVDESNANDGASRLPPSAHGVFVPVTFASNWTSTATQALAVPDVDGIAVDLAWTDIAATSPRTYDFTKLDPLLQLARDAGKGVELSVIGAGGTRRPGSIHCPSFIFSTAPTTARPADAMTRSRRHPGTPSTWLHGTT
jgi:hypothetical protein